MHYQSFHSWLVTWHHDSSFDYSLSCFLFIFTFSFSFIVIYDFSFCTQYIQIWLCILDFWSWITGLIFTLFSSYRKTKVATTPRSNHGMEGKMFYCFLPAMDKDSLDCQNFLVSIRLSIFCSGVCFSRTHSVIIVTSE